MSNQKKLKVGILGCGSIGSGIAKSTTGELKNLCLLSALYDIDKTKSLKLEKKLKHKGLLASSYENLLKKCDLVVEAIHSDQTAILVKKALANKKGVLAMSVGKLLLDKDVFSVARKNRCALLIPSGAIAGIDAIKAARLGHISQITLTTRKPLSGFSHIPYLKQKNIDLSLINKETVIFEGDVKSAVKHFPQNINVAATLALASQSQSFLKIRIITSPAYKSNSHEIEALGDFGRIVTRTENRVCPENPKTSYLAVLSAIQTLKNFCEGIRIGT